jgi:hypothetical protein
VALEDVVDGVAALLESEGCPANVLFDKVFVAENAEPPRVVFVPKQDSYSNPLQIQAAGQPGQNPSSLGANPKPLFTRTARAEVHIWARGEPETDPTRQLRADYAALGQLINAVARAIYKTGPYNNRITNGTTDQRTLMVRDGLVYTMTVEVDVPIVDVAWDDSLTWTDQSGVNAALAIELTFPDGSTSAPVNFTTP